MIVNALARVSVRGLSAELEASQPRLLLRLEDNATHQSHFDDPPLPPLGSYPLDQPTGDRNTTSDHARMALLPISRPAWSVREIDSPALGLSTRGSAVYSTPQPLIHPHHRAYRSPVPKFDILLAMQLRPGLGIGADSAWMFYSRLERQRSVNNTRAVMIRPLCGSALLKYIWIGLPLGRPVRCKHPG